MSVSDPDEESGYVSSSEECEIRRIGLDENCNLNLKHSSKQLKKVRNFL